MVDMLLSRNVCADGDTLVPFSLFRHIFGDILNEKMHDDDATFGSRSSSILSMRGREKEWEDLSIASDTSSLIQSKNKNIMLRLEQIADQINVPKSVVEIVGH